MLYRTCLLLLSIVFMLGLTSHAQDAPQERDVLAFITDNPAFSTFADAIQAADPELLAILEMTNWNFTIFAPTNEAFMARFEALGLTAKEAMNDPILLGKIVRYHMMPALYQSAQFAETSGATFGTYNPGINLVITADDEGLKINDARVIEADILLLNGRIHRIDRLLLPPEEFLFAHIQPPTADATEEPAETSEQPQTVLDILEADSNFSLLLSMMQATGQHEMLGLGMPYTYFAPTNAAIEATLETLGVSAETLMANLDTLSPILAYHILPGKHLSAELLASDGVIFGTHQPGTTVTLTLHDETIMLNDAIVLQTDLIADTGIVHVIDRVLLPQ